MERNVIESFNKLMITHKTMHRQYLEKLGLFFGQPRLMYQIKINPGLSQKELVDLLGVSKEAVSMSVRRLEKKGYILREVDEQDKRKYSLTLSEEGLKLLDEVLMQQNAAYQMLLEPLSQQEKERLQDLFEVMIEHVRKELEL